MTNRARMYLRYRDLDIPTSWEGATRERGRPARNLIRASSLRSRGIPSNSAPNGLCRVRYYGAKSYAGETPALPGGRSPIHSCSSRERVGLPGRNPAVQIMRESPLQYWQWDRSFCRQSRCSAYFNSRVRPGGKGSSPQKAQKSQNEFRDFESWQSEVDPHGDALTGCMQIARNLCDGFGSQRLAGFQRSALFVFLCFLWLSPAKVTLPNFAKGSSLRRLVLHVGSPAFAAAAYAARHP